MPIHPHRSNGAATTTSSSSIATTASSTVYNAPANADDKLERLQRRDLVLNANNMRPDGWTSADAAGLPVFPGLARYDEIAAGVIPHALRFTIEHAKAPSGPPATTPSSSTDQNRPPGGLRIRLKSSVDIQWLSHPGAHHPRGHLKDSGMILADNGSAI
ncbi:MAG: hypothetical protein U0232_00580 [Thermomicrobiales bacterium]